MKPLASKPFASYSWLSLILLSGAALLPALALPEAEGSSEIAKLVEQLGSEDFDEREAASKALDKIGEPALPALQKAALSDDLEASRRAVVLLEAISQRLRAATITELRRAGAKVVMKKDQETLVDEVDLTGLKEAAALLPRVARLPEVRLLDLRDTSTRDGDLASLGLLRNLEYLNLDRTKVEGEGLKHLRALKLLRIVRLSYTPLKDEGFDNLAGVDSLEELVANGTGVTDAGLKKLGTLKKLELLNLSTTKVTDAGLTHLRGMTRLRHLMLVGTEVTETGVAELKKVLLRLEPQR